jgi:hypothetical protein
MTRKLQVARLLTAVSDGGHEPRLIAARPTTAAKVDFGPHVPLVRSSL